MEKNKNIFVFLVVCLLQPLSCHAVLTMAPPPCKVWLVDRQPKGVVGGIPLMGPTAMLQMAWLGGFVSGIADGSGKDFLKGADERSIGVWMDKYCQANPERNTIEGAIDLAKEQMKQKGLMKSGR